MKKIKLILYAILAFVLLLAGIAIIAITIPPWVVGVIVGCIVVKISNYLAIRAEEGFQELDREKEIKLIKEKHDSTT